MLQNFDGGKFDKLGLGNLTSNELDQPSLRIYKQLLEEIKF